MKLSKTEKHRALHTLNKAVDKLSMDAALMETHHEFLSKQNSNYSVGPYSVKNTNGMYSVYYNNKCLYADIVVIEVLFKILEKLVHEKPNGIACILKHEREYVKELNNMKFYLHSYRVTRDLLPENRFVFQDRYDVALDNAERIKRKIRSIR